MNDTDISHMRHALVLGARGLGQVWPSPSVGCVIVNEGRIVGRGYTGAGGVPHAETIALKQAGSRARGAVVYVTLEPCSHRGRTPPCVEALISAGVARVVVATGDPNPQVNGRGLAALRSAGIEVQTGVLQGAADQQHAGFFSRIGRERPHVTLKLAASVDGRIATSGGESQWITGAGARRIVHAQRARHDAVMIGAGTARRDDPELTVRGLGVKHQPVRLVLSRQLDIPLQGKLALTARQVPVWIVHAKAAEPNLCDAWAGIGAQLLPCELGPDRNLDPKAALAALGEAGLTRIYCEGGGSLAASLIQADLVDELETYTAGLALGAGGTAMLAALELPNLANIDRFELLETRAVGDDVMNRWRNKR